MTERTYTKESDARSARRVFIVREVPVSLIGFDESRGLYVFDTYEPEPEAPASPTPCYCDSAYHPKGH